MILLIFGLLVKGNINSAKQWLNAKENTTEHKITSFSVKHYLNDKSPMPKDIIGPRILTPGDLLVISGIPKVGKSNFLLSLLAHLAAGVPFLKMTPTRPLRILYLQDEMEYDGIRRRVQELKINQELMSLVKENLVITSEIKITLNDEGIEWIKDTIMKEFGKKTVDLIAIDSLTTHLMPLSLLQNGIKKLRSATNPAVGIIMTHHTKKVSTATLEKSISGSGWS